MDQHTEAINRLKLEKTAGALKKNGYVCHVVSDEAEALSTLRELLHDGDSVAVGGSMTLFEIGVIDELRCGRYNFIDRYKEGLSRDELTAVHRSALTADAFITSSNAITENGELYNVDGSGNRVAAMLYGPESVIVIAGVNKIVPDIEAAKARVRFIAAPANCHRLGMKTPCAAFGDCMDCRSTDRICSDFVIMGPQRAIGRVKVILVAKPLGY